MLNEDQITQQLKNVIDQSSSLNNEGIGILTSENRDSWAQAYQMLSKGTHAVGTTTTRPR